MKKLIVPLIILALIIGSLPVQSVLTAENDTIEFIVPMLNFDEVGPFSEGLAMVKKDDKCGCVDKTGKVVIPLNYDYIDIFSEGLAIARKNDKFGFIDRSGNEVVPFIYDYPASFKEGMAMVERANKKGFVDKTGKEVVPLIYDVADYFHEGLARVAKNGQDGHPAHFGFVDKEGKEVIPLTYSFAWDFNEGLASVSKKLPSEGNSDYPYQYNVKFGFIDKTGKEIIPFVYDYAGSFSDGFARMGKQDKRGFVDKAGNEVFISNSYDGLYDVHKGLAEVQAKDIDKRGFVDTTGKEVIKPAYYVVSLFIEGLSCVYEKGKGGYIDKTGKEVIPLIYDFAGDFSEGLSSVGKDRKYGFIDRAGNEVIPFIFEYAQDFSEGLAWVKKDGKWSIIKNPLLANLSSSTVQMLVNSDSKQLNAYAINDYNYFKLRDLAYVLSGSNKRFDVSWDEDKDAINILRGKPYTIVGGEMDGGDGVPKAAETTTSKICIDGNEAFFNVYNIGGNNYFKLRDIAQVLDLDVTWDEATNSIHINTNATHSADANFNATASENKPYSIITETFSQDDIKLEYPQIKGLGDDDREKAINDLIKNDVLKSQVEDPLKFYQDETNLKVTLTMDMKYKITLNTTELLSMIFTGVSFIEGGAHPSFNVYCITIDLKNMTKLKLSDFTTIDMNLVQKIKQSTAVSNDSIDEEGMDNQGLIFEIQNQDDKILLQGLQEQYANYAFYLTPNSLVISVCITHVAGDYALVELPGQYTKK